MKHNADKSLIALLIRVYNHSIQYYYYFPEVIIFGNRRLEAEEFNQLLTNDFIEAYYTDSFGKLYQVSKKGEDVLYQFSNTKKRRSGSLRKGALYQCSLQL